MEMTGNREMSLLSLIQCKYFIAVAVFKNGVMTLIKTCNNSGASLASLCCYSAVIQTLRLAQILNILIRESVKYVPPAK